MNADELEQLSLELAALPEAHASRSRDYGRGYSAAIRDVLEILQRNSVLLHE